MTTRQTLLDYFHKNNEATAKDLIAATNITRSAVYNGLAGLKKMKHIRNAGHGIWVLATPKEKRKYKKRKADPFRSGPNLKTVQMGSCPIEMKPLMPSIKDLTSAMRATQTIELTITLTEDGASASGKKAAPEIPPFGFKE